MAKTTTRSRARTRTVASAPGAEAVAAPVRLRGNGYLAQLAEHVNKEYGEGSVVPARDVFKYMKHIPLGHLVGDLAMFGGLPEGQAAMFLGREGGGKTTQAMRCMAQMQRKYPDKMGLWVDSEETFDPLWAEQHGVDMDRLVITRIKAGEDVTDTLKTAKANAEELGMIVLDSVNQTTPMKEYDDSAGDNQVALHPRMMGRMCSALGVASKDRRAKGFDPVTEIFINQYRTNIGGPPMATKTIPGGMQLKHYCSTHLEFRSKVELDTDEGNKVPFVVEHVLQVKRTKMASSIRSGEYRVVVSPNHRLAIGQYDEAGTIVAQAKKVGMWEGAGTNQRFTTVDRKFRNMDEGKLWLEANPDVARRIKSEIIGHRRERVGMSAVPHDGYLLEWANAA